jgi:thiol reductant ABC exporter CydC subunit
MMFIAYFLGAMAFMGGIGLTVSSGWLITMASSHPPILTLGVAIVLVRFFGISRSVARYGERLVSHKAVFDRLTNLRVKMYSKLVGKSIAISSVVNSGTAVKALVDDVDRAQEYQLRIKLPASSAVISLAAAVLLGWWVRAESLFVTVPASIMLLFIVPTLVSRVNVPLARKLESQENNYNQVVEAAVHGVIEAQIYGYLQQSVIPAKASEDDIFTTEKTLVSRSSFFSLGANLIIASSIVGSAWLAESIMGTQKIPAVQVAMLIFLPLVMFEAITTWYPNLFVSGKLLASQMAVDSLLKSDTDQRTENQLNETITSLSCKDVKVAWSSNFMRRVSFEVDQGELLVIRGKSGAGKSTLIMGLLGQLPYTGWTHVNGKNLIEFSDLNQRIVGTVQRSHIFNTSLRENLKVGNSLATDDEIQEILKMLELDSLVKEMENGLDTIIGEFGRTVSGGEAKRIAIARVLLSQSDVYILDEPTTGLHFQDINLLLTVLNKLVNRGNTVLVIEHNLDMIKVADHIIDLGPEGGDAGGTVLYQGPPKGLIKHKHSHTGRFLKLEMQ